MKPPHARRRLAGPGAPPPRPPTETRAALAAVLVLLAPACSRDRAEAGSPGGGDEISSRRAADMVHAALAADREVYTEEIVQRLTVEQKVKGASPGDEAPVPLEAREDWRSEHAKLPLPAQMFRMGQRRSSPAATASHTSCSARGRSTGRIGRAPTPSEAGSIRSLAPASRSTPARSWVDDGTSWRSTPTSR